MADAVEFNTKRSGCYLGESAPLNIINEEIILGAGAGKCEAGTVLGQITADKTYVPHDPAAEDGSQTAAAILFHPTDTAATNTKTVATVRGPATVNGHMLTHADGISDANKAAAIDALRAKGMAVLPQHAS